MPENNVEMIAMAIKQIEAIQNEGPQKAKVVIRNNVIVGEGGGEFLHNDIRGEWAVAPEPLKIKIKKHEERDEEGQFFQNKEVPLISLRGDKYIIVVNGNTILDIKSIDGVPWNPDIKFENGYFTSYDFALNKYYLFKERKINIPYGNGNAPIAKKKMTFDNDNYLVYQYIGIAKKEGVFGIEVEVEGKNLPGNNKAPWVVKKDNSLRDGGLEYVLKNPLSIEHAKESILILKDYFKKCESQLQFSFRTSVHVHVNIMDMTKKQLSSFLYLSHLFEDALVQYSGEGRSGNRFCLRTRDAEQKVELFKEFISSKGIKGYHPEAIKYAAINLATICSYGSVEFRSMRGTIDSEILNPWFDILLNLRNLSFKYSLIEIATKIKEDPETFSREVFGEHYDKFFYQEFMFDLKESYFRLIEIPYMKGKL